MKYNLTKDQGLFFFGLLLFIVVANIPDLYTMVLGLDSWVPVNTPPMAIGDEYHYFSVLKMFAFGDWSLIPTLEFSRIIPHLLNLPAYYLGTFLFDVRFGVLFVRLFNIGLLFTSLVYFFCTISDLHNKKRDPVLILLAIFVVFYGFSGFQTLFSQHELQGFLSAVKNNPFSYFSLDSYVYNHASFNSLARAVNSSTTAPIMLFIFSYTLKQVKLSLGVFTALLFILMFSNFPAAVAFGAFCVLLEILKGEEKAEVIKKLTTGGLAGLGVALLQSKLIFSLDDSGKEVMNFAFNFSFKFGFIIAPLCAIGIAWMLKKKIPESVMLLLLVLSLFQPIAYVIGGTHGSRFWIRSTIIPFICLFAYLIINYINARNRWRSVTALAALLVVFFSTGFMLRNAAYLYEHKERVASSEEMLSYVLAVKKPAYLITNSPELMMLVQLYDRNLTPLMGHYSLQKDGYVKNLARMSVNFELMGISEKKILDSISKEAPRYRWLGKRVGLNPSKESYHDFYFDNLLFITTYATYNVKMLYDGVKTVDNFLSDKFFTTDLKTDKGKIYAEIKSKKLTVVVDKSMPLVPLELIKEDQVNFN